MKKIIHILSSQEYIDMSSATDEEIEAFVTAIRGTEVTVWVDKTVVNVWKNGRVVFGSTG